MELTIEQKRARTEKIAKVVIAGVVCLAVSPIIFMVVKGLIGLIVAVAVGFTALQLTPYFAMKVGNVRMQMIRAEANKNPIETMNNVFRENMVTIQEKDQKIAQFEARLGDFKSKMSGFSRDFPNDVQQFADVAAKMQLVLTRQKTKQRAAKVAAQEFHKQIVRAENIYEMALAAHAVQELSANIEKQVFQDIKKRVAFDSVTHSFNVAVAELSVEADTDPDIMIGEAPSQVRGALPESTGGSYDIPKATILDAEVVSVPVKRGSR